MGIGMMPLEPLSVDGRQGVCSTCADPEHAPGGKGADHPFTMRVKPVGYVLFTAPDECPACGAPPADHEYLDVDLALNILACDRQPSL